MTNRAFISALDAGGVLPEGEARALFRKCRGDVFAAMGHILNQGKITKKELGKLWGDSANVAYVNLDEIIIQPDVVKKLPENTAKRACMIPLYQFGDAVTVAMTDPRNVALIEEAEEIMGVPISPVFTFPEDIQRAIATQYQTRTETHIRVQAHPQSQPNDRARKHSRPQTHIRVQDQSRPPTHIRVQDQYRPQTHIQLRDRSPIRSDIPFDDQTQPDIPFHDQTQTDIRIQDEPQADIRLEEWLENIPQHLLIEDMGKATSDKLKRIAWEKSVLDFIQAMLTLSARELASAIHIDERAEDFQLDFRIGILQNRLVMKKPYFHPLAYRLKLLAKLDGAKRGKPMKGRFSIEIAGKMKDYVFSSVPTVFGEKIVLRPLNIFDIREAPNPDEIGLSRADHASLTDLAAKPNGLFIVCGSRGSGRKVTLCSLLRQVSRPGINVMAVADLGDTKIPGVTQVLCSKGVDCKKALATVFEQDPDVILLDEITDRETAEIAVQAARSGCLVLSPMYAGNALEIPFRLVEMGVDPFQVSAALIGGTAQRLPRRICDTCKERYELDSEAADRLFARDENEPVIFYRGKGCPECDRTGYRGYVPIYELFALDREIRAMVSKSASPYEIENHVSRNGHRSMRYDGMKKTLRGLTTIEELDRVAGTGEF